VRARDDRVFLVVSEALDAGRRAAQAVHAALAFAAEHPAIERAWRARSNTVVVLAAPQVVVAGLADEARSLGAACSVFHEPDLGGALTAVALAPGPVARRLTRALAPLR
jgi:hypothetical protein